MSNAANIEASSESVYVASFENLRMTDVDSVGGKNASLGEMISQLASAGVRVPGGFATTAQAFRDFLSHSINGVLPLAQRIADRLATNLKGFTQRGDGAGVVHRPTDLGGRFVAREVAEQHQ